MGCFPLPAVYIHKLNDITRLQTHYLHAHVTAAYLRRVRQNSDNSSITEVKERVRAISTMYGTFYSDKACSGEHTTGKITLIDIVHL